VNGVVLVMDDTRALERAAEGQAKLVSIILKPCGWEHHEAAKFQVLPSKGKPVWKHNPRTNAWFDVQEGLRKLAKSRRSFSVQTPCRPHGGCYGGDHAGKR